MFKKQVKRTQIYGQRKEISLDCIEKLIKSIIA